MLGIPSTVTATIQPEINLRNHYLRGVRAGFVASRRRSSRVNYGLRVEWEDGITEDDGRDDRRLRPDRAAGDLGSGRSRVREGATSRSCRRPASM